MNDKEELEELNREALLSKKDLAEIVYVKLTLRIDKLEERIKELEKGE